MTRDTLYMEKSNGRWETWTYSDGQRVFLRSFPYRLDVINWAGTNDYKLVEVK